MNISTTEKQDKDIFKAIFRDHWDEFTSVYPAYKEKQYTEPVRKMLECGTESNGYSEYWCMECGRDLRRVCFSCKSCFCLSCAKVYVDNFVEQVGSMLHPGVVYRHIVLTIPAQLRPIFYQHRHEGRLLSQLMRCGYTCLEDVLSTAARHPLKIGATVVVQTHGRSGSYNPHLHIMMSSGGIDEDREQWVDQGYFPYTMLHKKWQYHLFGMVKQACDSPEVVSLLDTLWKKYPHGLVAHVQRGEVPEGGKGLARYLAKYVASPPIAVRRILTYADNLVTYWYQDHLSHARKVETIDVLSFIGRMVQHIFPKGFQRVRYYGLQATKTFKKWCEKIKEGMKRIGRVVQGAYQVVTGGKTYRKRYEDGSGQDPLVCRYCGAEMELVKLWHPKHGTFYDELENIKQGKYETILHQEDIDHHAIQQTIPIQLSFFPLDG
jgi:hypothetical protein